MSHLGIFCPNSPGHINPMIALADAHRSQGHRVTFFLLGDPPESVKAAGFETVEIGGSVCPRSEYQALMRHLGTLSGRPALKHTFSIGIRSAEAILKHGPEAVRQAGIDALIVDQVSNAAGTVADELKLPFVTVCNALMLHAEAGVPPLFTHRHPRKAVLASALHHAGWTLFERMYRPILSRIQQRRRALGLSVPRRISATWSDRLQISQQPRAFDFPRRRLPSAFRYSSPFRLPNHHPAHPFPWERLDGRPLIYGSLGTLQNRVAETYRMMAEACDGLEAQLVISTGRGVDSQSLGDLPGQPIVVDYAPQLDLIRRSTLILTHAGLNTVLDALSAGVPMVAMPVTNEQPGIAARVAWVGAGISLPLQIVTAERLRACIKHVMEDSTHLASAQRIRDAIQEAGGAGGAAGLIAQALEVSAG